MNTRPTMHCQSELEADLGYSHFLPDATLFKWFNDAYSTSQHLLTLYSLAVGLRAKSIVEVGFGRSSFVLAKAAAQNHGTFYSCDSRDFSYLLNDDEKSITDFTCGFSSDLWKKLSRKGIDFAFLDYFSDPSISEDFVLSEINSCFSLLKENGIICIHDSEGAGYKISQVLKKLKGKFGGILINNHIDVISIPYNYGLAILRKTCTSEFGRIEDHFVKKKEVL